LKPLNGAGVTVAVIDSGIDPNHAALKGRVLTTVDFTGGDGVDRFGHGTHVAGIIAGQAGTNSDTKQIRGVASGAYLVNLRVLGDDGSGVASSVIEAIQWAIAHRRQYNIRVINLSLGGPVLQPYGDDPMCEAVERAVAAGITVVVAAGNLGKTKDGALVFGGITSPGNDPAALTVGATDTHDTPERSDDTVALYSSRGPTRFDLVIKPDVVAPGSHIVSAEAAGSYLAKNYPELHVAGSGSGAYVKLSGTSMSAAVASGAVALLLHEQPQLKPAHIRTILQLTSTFLSSAGLMGSGAGSLNAFAGAELVSNEPQPTVTIAGEDVSVAGITWQSPSVKRKVDAVGTIVFSPESKRIAGKTILWGTSDTIVWGTNDTILWGTSDTIVWGTNDTILWGTSDTIVWGTADTIVWGT
jgi:serine protease AprX